MLVEITRAGFSILHQFSTSNNDSLDSVGSPQIYRKTYLFWKGNPNLKLCIDSGFTSHGALKLSRRLYWGYSSEEVIFVLESSITSVLLSDQIAGSLVKLNSQKRTLLGSDFLTNLSLTYADLLTFICR